MKKNIFRIFSIILIASLIFTFMPQVAGAASPRPGRDRVAPTAPRSLKARTVTDSSVTLAWSASRDAYGVQHYVIYRNGIRVAMTAERTCTIGGLQPNRSYRFTVRAFDAAGNRSRTSNTAAIRTRKAVLLPPAPPVAAVPPAVAPAPVPAGPLDAAAPVAAAPATEAAPAPALPAAESTLPTQLPAVMATPAPTLSAAVPVPLMTTAPPPATGDGFQTRAYSVFSRDSYGSSPEIVISADGLCQVDVGSTARGVVLARINVPDDGRRWMAIVKGPSGTYSQDLPRRQADLGLPLAFGSGDYTVSLYEQVSGTSYSPHQVHSFRVTLESELSPFTAASVLADFSAASASTRLAAQLTDGKSTQAERIDAIYQWVSRNVRYDRELAASISSGTIRTYVPNPDAVLAAGKGICYDYSALMAAMLRSQGIPARIIIGQTALGYHAWNEVWIEGSGWLTLGGASYQSVSGSAWIMLDATLAASGSLSLETIRTMTRTRERIF